jgi:hypothetical protein
MASFSTDDEFTLPVDFRDEMNFAEFPISSVSDTIPTGQKTLVFQDRIFDRGKQAQTTRTLTVSGSEMFGLPTALDDEVLLGLIQLSHARRFEDKKVYFTRYQLIRLLDWRNESKSYERISESLSRWLGVTLYYDKAWWSKEENCWVDEKFHILDNVTILDRERRYSRMRSAEQDPTAGYSSFVWNDVVFSSFKAGYIKQLDFSLYKSLSSPVAKRIYRFLDKRFYHRDSLRFKLKDFAFDHVGLSRRYHNGEIKRRLIPAIEELERAQFLQPLSASERFVSISRGEWEINLIKRGADVGSLAPEAEKNVAAHDRSSVLDALRSRGVSTGVAKQLVAQFSETTIKEKVSLHDELCARDDSRISKNSAGFLVSSIKNDFPLAPKPKATAGRGPETTSRIITYVAPPPREPSPAEAEREMEYERVLSSLDEEGRRELEERAIENASGFMVRNYMQRRAQGGPLFEAVRKILLSEEIVRMSVAKTAQDLVPQTLTAEMGEESGRKPSVHP